MKIFLISRGVPTKEEPTWGNFELEQAKALKELGNDVVVLSIDTRFRFFKRKFGISEVNYSGIPCFNLFVIPFIFLKPFTIRFINRIRTHLLHKVYKHAVAKHGEPDVIYSHYLYNTASCIKLSDIYKIPLVSIEHWSKLDTVPFSPSIRNLALDTYPKCSNIISVSRSLQNNILQECGINSTVISNLVDAQHFSSLTDTKQTNHNNAIRFISIGALIPRKNHIGLIKAFNNLSLPNDSWHLRIIGAGKQKDKIRKLIKKHNLDNNIELLGQKNKRDIMVELNNSDVFVLNSNSETFGVVFIEALAAGLPVIGTKCGGPEDIITPNNGILVDTNNQSQLIEAIEYMVANHLSYNNHAIAQECRNRFSSTVIAPKIDNILKQSIKHYKH